MAPFLDSVGTKFVRGYFHRHELELFSRVSFSAIRKNNPTEASPYYQRLLENEIIQPAQSQAPGSPEPPRPNGAKEESTVSSAFSSTKQPVLTEADQSPCSFSSSFGF
jgi:hypothetical protein